jgi:hypothetical protein
LKKIIAAALIPVLLLLSGCVSGKVPVFCVCPKFSGTAFLGKDKFDADMDFEVKNPKITMNNAENVFKSEYIFYDESVKIKYDDIECDVELSKLPKGNIPLVIFKVFNSLKNKENIKWEYDRTNKNWTFSGKYNDLKFTGKCDTKGKIISFAVPEIQISFYTKNFG